MGLGLGGGKEESETFGRNGGHTHSTSEAGGLGLNLGVGGFKTEKESIAKKKKRDVFESVLAQQGQ